MTKYFISILIIILMVISGVYQVQSQTEIKEKYKNNIDNNRQYANIYDTMIKVSPEQIKPELVKEEKINNHIIMKASAYTKSKEEGTHKGITKSGVQVSRGIVSVDTRIIPLGTKLYIEGYGYATALDTGGAIKNDRIDLYMDTKKEAFEFGRQEVRVWIIEDDKTIK